MFADAENMNTSIISAWLIYVEYVIIEQASNVVDEKLKESEQFLDEKREEAVKSVTSGDSMLNPSAVLGKAKGFLNCKYRILII